ncbi:hypothetical protein ACQP1U_15470 [Actinomycetota bacterium]
MTITLLSSAAWLLTTSGQLGPGGGRWVVALVALTGLTWLRPRGRAPLLLIVAHALHWDLTPGHGWLATSVFAGLLIGLHLAAAMRAELPAQPGLPRQIAVRWAARLLLVTASCPTVLLLASMRPNSTAGPSVALGIALLGLAALTWWLTPRSGR